jgi:hypothetical protein
VSGVPQIQKADPQARRRAVTLILVTAVVGAGLILLLRHYEPMLESWIMQDPAAAPGRIRLVLLGLVALAAVPLLAFAVYLWRFGDRIIRAQRFPPPGLGLVRDTAVIEGDEARRRGRLVQVLALCLGVVACGLAVMLWRLAALFEGFGT